MKTSIRTRMILWIGLPTLVVYVITLGLTLAYMRQRSEAEIAEGGTRLSASFAARFDGCLREAAAVAETTARSLAAMPLPNKEKLFDQLRGNTEHTPFIFGAALAFEPGTYPAPPRLFAPYVCRDGEGFKQLVIDETVYDWLEDPKYTWFQEPKQLKRGVWSAPYFDEGAGNTLMTTYSTPFEREGQFSGVATVDIDLVKLRETIGQEIVGDLEYVILTWNGQFVYSKETAHIMRDTIQDLASKAERNDLARAIPGILSGEPGNAIVSAWDSPGREWLFHAPIPSANWTFMVCVPDEVILAGVRFRTFVGATGLASTLVLILLCIAFVSARISKPLRRLSFKVAELADGNLDVHVDEPRAQDEVAELARGFNAMTSQLQAHIRYLAEEQSARARIERDLSIARDIQRDLLPNEVPKLPGFDLAAWSLPADETGGDYYDWQVLPGNKVAISLADATGHGIGPALVTAVCRAYARASFPSENDIGLALDRINDLLVEDLTDGRFVTFVVALLDVPSRRLQLLSAGHAPLFLYRAADRRVHEFDAHHIPFGIAAQAGYGPPSTIQMEVGDILVLITDGFFEWANPQAEMFGTERLAEHILAAKDQTAADMIQTLYKAVKDFSGGTKQMDDVTAVILKRTA